MIIATSPTPICCRLSSNRPTSDTIARGLPELPDDKKARFIAAGLSAYDASVLVAEKETADYFRSDGRRGCGGKSGRELAAE